MHAGMKYLARLCRITGLSEPSLPVTAKSAKISCSSPNVLIPTLPGSRLSLINEYRYNKYRLYQHAVELINT